MTQKKSNLITVRMTPTQVGKLRAMCREIGDISVADLVRSLVDHASLEPVARFQPTVRIPMWQDAKTGEKEQGIEAAI